MSIIEKAAKRLEELRQAGVSPAPSAEHARIAAGPMAGTVPQAVAELRATDPSAPAAQSRRIDLELPRLAAEGFVTPDSPRSGIADEFRILKRPLIANASGKGAAVIDRANLIMVTSSLPGEGKTFCAMNLAMSIAMELDRSVLLVDADVARPSMPKLLGISEGLGLLDVLVGEARLGEVLLRTNVAKLAVLTSGKSHPKATELLASEAMERLLLEISSRYADRIVIFDSPPLLVTTEARVLATRMGQVVFVVKAEQTKQSDVRHALAAIESCPVKLLVLNQATSTGQGAYGYGRGYGYGYGS